MLNLKDLVASINMEKAVGRCARDCTCCPPPDDAEKERRRLRAEIRAEVIAHLELNGFTAGVPDRWYKSTHRPCAMISFTFHDFHIEKYVRENPSKEGWSVDKYPYSRDILDDLKQNCNW